MRGTTTLTGAFLPGDVAAVTAVNGTIRWLFTREDQTIELEAQGDGGHCLARVRWPNRAEEVRRFARLDQMLAHLQALARQLRHSDFVYREQCIEIVAEQYSLAMD